MLNFYKVLSPTKYSSEVPVSFDREDEDIAPHYVLPTHRQERERQPK